MLDANGGRIAGPLKGYKGMDGYRPGITKAIKEDEKIAYLDSFGKEITGGWKAADRYAGFTQTSTYNQQLRFTDVHDSTYEYHGEPVTIMFDPLFPSIISPVKNGRAILHKEGKPGMLDTLGNIIVPFGKYDTINEFSHGLARCVGNETVSFIDKNGKVVIGPLSYPEVAHFHEGLARIYTGKNFAFIDTTGKIVIKLKGLEGVYDFSEGLCHVIKGDKHGFIDKKGKYVIKPELYYDEVKDFSDGLALVYVNNLYGYIDRSGKQVITLEKYYSSVSSFKNGAAELREDWNSQPVLLGKNGKVLPYMYDEGSEWQYGYRKVREGSLNGIVNTKQELIVPVKYWRASITRNGLIDLGEYDGDEFKHLGYYHPGTKKMLFED